jgi:hypothetical protein
MPTSLDEICDGLEVDLCLARLRAVAAGQRLRAEDTAANRVAAARCRAQVDVILDLLIELRGTPPRSAESRAGIPPGAVPPRRVPGWRVGR